MLGIECESDKCSTTGLHLRPRWTHPFIASQKLRSADCYQEGRTKGQPSPALRPLGMREYVKAATGSQYTYEATLVRVFVVIKSVKMFAVDQITMWESLLRMGLNGEIKARKEKVEQKWLQKQTCTKPYLMAGK